MVALRFSLPWFRRITERRKQMDVEVIFDIESGATEKVCGEAEEENDVRNFSCSCTMAKGSPSGV
jgi:hypothetical protein